MSTETDRARGGFEIVTLSVGEYRHHKSVPADTEAEFVLRLLRAVGGSGDAWTAPPTDRHHAHAVGRLAAWAAPRTPRSSVLYWVGHGASDGDEAWLATHDTGARMSGTGLKPEDLADHVIDEWRTRAADGSAWALVVIEACGAARFVELLGAALFRRAGPPRRLALIGVGGYGAAHLGAFRSALDLALSSYTDNDGSIQLRDLIGRLQERIDPGAVIEFPDLHRARPILRRGAVLGPVNAPIDVYSELREAVLRLPPDERGHFLPKALGAEQGELAWYFTGRQAERQRIAAWLNTRRTGMLVVTGRAGAGKSALLGNVLVHGNPRLRDLLIPSGTPSDQGDDDGDGPGASGRMPEGAFDAVIHLTGMTVGAAADRIGRAAGIATNPQAAPGQDVDDLLTGLAERAAPFTVLVDALDEAQEPVAIAESVLRPIAGLPGCRVVVGTRASLDEGPDRPEPAGRELLDLLTRDTDAEFVMVERDTQAVESFVRRRLGTVLTDRFGAVPDGVDAERIGRIAADIGGRSRTFLYARIAVHEILAEPQLLAEHRAADLAGLLGRDHRALFAAAVRRLAAKLPAAGPLLEALALARGRGLPRADRTWAVVADALAGAGGPRIAEDDIDALLTAAAPYVMLDAESDQSVYRLAHRTFQEHFLASSDSEVRSAERVTERPDVPTRHLAIAAALVERARLTGQNSRGAYVTRHLSGHVADAGAWQLLGGDPALLDDLDPDAVAADVLRTGFGRADVPAAVNAVLGARHLLAAAEGADRTRIRELAEARLGTAAGAQARRFQQLRWARLRREPPHVVLTGHAGGINALVSVRLPTGRTLLASAGDDGTVRLWDCTTGRPIAEPLLGHTGPVNALAVLPQIHGRTLLASAGHDGAIRLWDCATGSPAEEPLLGHTGPVNALAVLAQPGGGTTLLASAGADRTIHVWGLTDGDLRGSLLGYTDSVSALTTLPQPSGRPLLAVLSEDRIRLWNSTSRRAVGDLPHWPAAATLLAAVEVQPGRAALAVAGRDSVHLLDFETGRDSGAVLTTGAGTLTALAPVPRPDGSTLLAVSGDDHTVRLWDPRSRAAVGHPLVGHTEQVRAIAAVPLSADRILLASTGADATIRLWDPAPDGGRETERQGHSDWVNGVAVTRVHNRRVLASVADDRTLRLWDVATGESVAEPITGHNDWVRAVAAVPLPDGDSLLATCGWDGVVRLWNPRSGRALSTLRAAHNSRLTALAVLSRPGDSPPLVAVGGSDRSVRLFEATTGRGVGRPLLGHTGTIRALAALPATEGPPGLATGGDDGTVRLWDLADSRQIGPPLRGHKGAVTALACIPGPFGRPLLASGGDDQALWFWDPDMGIPALTSVAAHGGPVTALTAIGPDRAGAALLASGSADQTVRLWDPHGGRLVRTLVLGVSVRGLAALDGSELAVAADAGVFVFRTGAGR